MRIILPLLAAATLPLAACATGPYGSGYGNDPLSSILGSIGSLGGAYNNAGYGYGSSSFSQAAVSACANTAARYGQVGVRDVRQVSSTSMKVYGSVSTGYSARNWDCTFRSDGRNADFDI